jgi:hypothetical protein
MVCYWVSFTFTFYFYSYKGQFYSQIQQIAICNSSIYELKEKLSLYTHTIGNVFLCFLQAKPTVKMCQP